MERIQVHDKIFRPLIPQEKIEAAIEALAGKINAEYRAETEPPLFIVILNGAFMFAAQLFKHLDFPCEICFVKLASYEGLHSQGSVRELIGLNAEFEGRKVVIVEDLVDTGRTVNYIRDKLLKSGASEVEVACLLLKAGAERAGFPIRFGAMEAGDEFIIGYGFDYNGLGRNLKDIYVIE
ncbi:MAG: hypoxanthine phosphoribosyltransferase [Bacteroidales bacterium]|nr:hypoxanthine phosphoribosyltransferase [Bacteroidales bacterium]